MYNLFGNSTQGEGRRQKDQRTGGSLLLKDNLLTQRTLFSPNFTSQTHRPTN